MDDGYTIPGLNEGYTLAGAKLMEWMSGFVMAMILLTLLHIKGSATGPLGVAVLIGTTLGMAQLRRGFPDEERGLRNACMTAMGFEPPGIPSPAAFKPYWSGAPLRKLSPKTYFEQLKLEILFDGSAALEDPGSIFLKDQGLARGTENEK